MEILKIATEREATGARVFHMEAGEPGSGAPQKVIDRAARSGRVRCLVSPLREFGVTFGPNERAQPIVAASGVGQ